MRKVYYFTNLNKLPEIMKLIGISSFKDKDVLVKLHMGERKNQFFPRPTYVKQHIDILKSIQARPFLYDTTVLYRSDRFTEKGYHQVAVDHGFTMDNVGCEVVIDDEGIPVTVKENIYEVGKTLHQTSHVLALTHVKGHIATGMGGAIKNFGMGGVTKKTKGWLHRGSKPIYQKDNCSFCEVCSEVCPFQAINVARNDWNVNERSCFGCGVCVENCSFNALDYKRYDLQYTLACAAKACVDNKNVLYVNELKRISNSCDCDSNAGPIICPDVGYVASNDIVSVDAASLDLIHNIKPDIFRQTHRVNPEKQIHYAENIGLGRSEYELISI